MSVQLILLVKNGCSILPEFLCHHENLFDRIHLIDHNSSYDLSVLSSDITKVYRVDLKSYFQEEYVSVVVSQVKLDPSLQWLFILDVDEFLPFTSREDFGAFLSANKSHKVVSFHWRNGLPLDLMFDDPKIGVSDSRELLFYSQLSSSKKCAVNVALCGTNFYIPRSNHCVVTETSPVWRRLVRKNASRAIKDETVSEALYHILSTSHENFVQKIAQFKELRKVFDGVNGHGGSLIYKYPEEYDLDDWLRYTANYRVGRPEDHRMVTVKDFSRFFDFNHCDRSQISFCRDLMLSKPVAPVEAISSAEQNVISKKRQFGQSYRMYDAFKIEESRIILSGD